MSDQEEKTPIYTKRIRWMIQNFPQAATNPLQHQAVAPNRIFKFQADYGPKQIEIKIKKDGKVITTNLLHGTEIKFCIADDHNPKLHMGLFSVNDQEGDLVLYLHDSSDSYFSGELTRNDYEVKFENKDLENADAIVCESLNGTNPVKHPHRNCFIIKNDMLYTYPDSRNIDIKVKIVQNLVDPVIEQDYCSDDHDFTEFYDKNIFTDFTINCSDGVDLQVHRIFLAKASNYFKKMLTIDMKEKKKNFVKFSDINSITMNQVLDFIFKKVFYCESPTDTINLLYAADKFELDQIKELCSEKLLQLVDETNVLEVYACAELYEDAELLNACANIIMENFWKIKQSKQWKALTNKQFTKIMEVVLEFNSKHSVQVHVTK